MSRPLDWIQNIESALATLDEKPQFALPQEFDWKDLEKNLSEVFGDHSFTLSHKNLGWIASDQILKGLGGDPKTLSIACLPLKKELFFITDKQNLKELMSELFESEEAANFFYDSAYVEGFYSYFATQVLYAIEKQKFLNQLTPRLSESGHLMRQLLGEESCFAIDIQLNLNGKNLWGRLLLSESFRKEWKSHFAQLPQLPLSEEFKSKLPVEIGIELGYTALSLKEWSEVKSGDFILLDRCSFDPEEHEGSVVLALNHKPLFRGRLKKEGIKITNISLYEEVREAMADDPLDQEFEFEDEDDFDDDDEDEEIEEEDFSLYPDSEEKKEKPIPKKVKAESVSSENEPRLTADHIPIHLVVEAGRIRMSASELMNLAPGNLIDLQIAPEQGVDLVVNGKKIGRGELIRMGDVLGVRIL